MNPGIADFYNQGKSFKDTTTFFLFITSKNVRSSRAPSFDETKKRALNFSFFCFLFFFLSLIFGLFLYIESKKKNEALIHFVLFRGTCLH